MSDETKGREKLEMKVECEGGWGLIQCEADGRNNAMAVVVRKLATAFPFPLARPPERNSERPPLGNPPPYIVERRVLDELNTALGERHLHVVNAIEAVRNLAHWTRETEHKVRNAVSAEVAERLCAIICPDRRAPADMAWVEQKVHGLVKFQQEHATPDAVRDAALEEAAQWILGAPCLGALTSPFVAANIRALKSKPAPAPDDFTEERARVMRALSDASSDPASPLCAGMSLEEAVGALLKHSKRAPAVRDAALEEAEKAVLHAARKDRRDVYADREQYEAHFCGWTEGANAALDAVRALKSKVPDCLTPGCEKPTGHAPPHEPCGAPVITPEQERELAEFRETRGKWNHVPEDAPVHDFAWALSRMHDGKRVRRPDWDHQSFVVMGKDCVRYANGAQFAAYRDNMEATDWEVAE